MTSPPEATTLHHRLVDTLIEKEVIKSARIEAAFRAIPRHHFLPNLPLDQVYSDEAIPTKKSTTGETISSSSQPAMMAIMLEQLALQPGHRVLEIGTGTGYNAALIAHIVGSHGQVVTLDLDADLTANAKTHLQSVGLERIHVINQDGVMGYPLVAPYDRIILSVGAWDIAPAWYTQLRPGGRIVLPLTITPFEERSIAFDEINNTLVSRSIEACGFMKLRGSYAATSEVATCQIGPEPGLQLQYNAKYTLEPEKIYEWLTGPSQDWDSSVEATWQEIAKPGLWFRLLETDYGIISASPQVEDQSIVPPLFVWPGKWRNSRGILNSDGLALAMVPLDQLASPINQNKPTRLPIRVRSFGTGEQAAQKLLQIIEDWNRTGRLAQDINYIKAMPKTVDYQPAENETITLKQWTKLAVARTA